MPSKSSSRYVCGPSYHCGTPVHITLGTIPFDTTTTTYKHLIYYLQHKYSASIGKYTFRLNQLQPDGSHLEITGTHTPSIYGSLLPQPNRAFDAIDPAILAFRKIVNMWRVYQEKLLQYEQQRIQQLITNITGNC